VAGTAALAEAGRARPETAIVTGPKGEEIYTDEYGRVKVRFHWDRSSTEGDKSTCWIRVSQTGGLGNVILPRVGHEVIIDFLDGNPDRPVVVGRVFNKENMPIYPLPDNKTRALWRTKRYGDAGSYGAAKSLDTGAPGANELRFEDKGGKEEVFLHAERDMTLRVRHSESHNIGLDQSIDIGGSRDVKIQETDSNDVGKSIKISAERPSRSKPRRASRSRSARPRSCSIRRA
jgi:type VI secretion system secreted protein VgrG